MLGFGCIGEFALAEFDFEVAVLFQPDRIVYVLFENRFAIVFTELRVTIVPDDGIDQIIPDALPPIIAETGLERIVDVLSESRLATALDDGTDPVIPDVLTLPIGIDEDRSVVGSDGERIVHVDLEDRIVSVIDD